MTAQSHSTIDPILSQRRSCSFNGENYTCNYVYEYNGIVFDVLLSPDTPLGYDTTDSIERQYLQTLQSVEQCNGDDGEDINRMFKESERTQDEIGKDVLEVCKSTIQALALSTEVPEKYSLHSWMYPPTINLQLVTKEGSLTVVKREDLPNYDENAYITDPEVLAINLPHHMVSDIRVLTELNPSIYKVDIEGQIMVAKLARSNPHDSITKEIKKLYGFQTSVEGPLARVPQIKGFVSSPTGVVGFLLNYIPSLCHNLEFILYYAKITSGSLPRNEDAPSPPTMVISKERREKWTSEIRETLHSIHARNVIWGDAKSANVLVDKVTDDIWIVDFGGGNTWGWIDRELHGSKAGDLQALDRITAQLATV